jgi:alkanesulfonate monooxygenase SsuD/methylene tetrahydromethanopterin reductase-like flavin-dependent oxidoreductase (luciferase family)
MVMFSDRPWPMRLPAIERNREMFRRYHGAEAPTLMITDFCICAPRLDEAEALARKHMGKFVESNFHHYEFLSEHFATVKGYDAYAQKAEIARKGGLEGAIEGFMKAAVWGTPDRILRELEARRAVIGDFELNVAFRFGGIPYEKAEASLRLFSKEVLPTLKGSRPAPTADAAK